MEIQSSVDQLQNITNWLILLARGSKGQDTIWQSSPELQIDVVALLAFRGHRNQTGGHHGKGGGLLAFVTLETVLTGAVIQVGYLVDQVRQAGAAI